MLKKFEGLRYIILGMLISGVMFGTGTYAATVISANKISYTDNFSLGADNVQAAIDGTCTKFSNQLTELKKSMYPVGSIYISTKLSTTTAVTAAIGGTWQAFGNGKVLRSSTGTSEQTGGSNKVAIATKNLPNHTHTYTPSGSVTSTFSNGKTSEDGLHSHSENWSYGTGIYGNHAYGSNSDVRSGSTSNAGLHSHTVTGTVTSKFTGNASSTTGCNNCSGDELDITNEYITVYMYKRTS